MTINISRINHGVTALRVKEMSPVSRSKAQKNNTLRNNSGNSYRTKRSKSGLHKLDSTDFVSFWLTIFNCEGQYVHGSAMFLFQHHQHIYFN